MFNQKLIKRIEDLEKKVKSLESFESHLIHIGAKDKDKVLKKIAEYLFIKNKHSLENITMKVMPSEEEIKIDKQALSERQAQELEDLWKKHGGSTDNIDVSFPAKK